MKIELSDKGKDMYIAGTLLCQTTTLEICTYKVMRASTTKITQSSSNLWGSRAFLISEGATKFTKRRRCWMWEYQHVTRRIHYISESMNRTKTHVSRDSHYGTLYRSWPVVFGEQRDQKFEASTAFVALYTYHCLAYERNIRKHEILSTLTEKNVLLFFRLWFCYKRNWTNNAWFKRNRRF